MFSRDAQRPDLSERLIHFTRGTRERGPLEVLLQILKERKLRGSSGYVKGGLKCVSFTETPMPVLSAALQRQSAGSRYAPYGVSFAKPQIFRLGGRPVIYQPSAEFALLPSALRWRHVRFDLNAASPIDWTWEREWRLPGAELPFTPADVTIVLPDETAAAELRRRIDHEAYEEAFAWTMVLGELAWGYYQPTVWPTALLKRSE